MAADQEIEFLRAYGAGVTSDIALTGNNLGNYLIAGSGRRHAGGAAPAPTGSMAGPAPMSWPAAPTTTPITSTMRLTR